VAVPERWQGEGNGPGRLGGYRGLARADQLVPLTVDQAIMLARTMRRWHRAQGGKRKAKVFRTDTRTGKVTTRTVLRPIKRMRATAGFLVVNDGPAVALMLANRLIG